MPTLEEVLTQEHHDIDAGIEEFLGSLVNGDLARKPLERAMAALKRHIYLEETILFPPLREAGLMMPVMVMLREHGELWTKMDAIDQDATEAACNELLALLEQHNSKEEPILYPHADKTLSGDVSDRLRTFLEAGHIPDGWVCQALA